MSRACGEQRGAEGEANAPDRKPEVRRRLAKSRLAPMREAAVVEELAQYQSEDKYARRLVARLALWRANVTETTGLHVDCCVGAGAGDWREHGDFEYGQRLYPASLARGKARRTGRAILGRQKRR